MLLEILLIAVIFLSKAENSARPVDHSEIETLRKECEAAKQKAKKTLEKYLSESYRLKAIIDEQQGILTFTGVVEAL